MKIKNYYSFIGLGLACICLCGCEATFSQKQEFKTIERIEAQWIDAAIRLNVGDLAVSSGKGHLMNARFDYLQPTRRPEVSYEESGDRGMLSIQQSARTSVGEFSHPGEKNKWNILFNTLNPINLDVHVDRGVSLLNLGLLNSRRINIEGGEGDIFVNMVGQREAGILVTIDGGTGYLEIKLPTDMGVRMQFKEGSHDIKMENFVKQDEYIVNAAYGTTDVFIDMIISNHTGPIQLISASMDNPT